MLKNETQLRYFIKKSCQNILYEQTMELDDIIGDFSNEYEKEDDENKKKLIIRKNNVLLEIILLLIAKKSLDFKKFYENSEFNVDRDFLSQQDSKKNKDERKFKDLIIKFKKDLEKIGDENRDIKLIKCLNNLKNALSDYIPNWYPLQYLFYNIDTAELNNLLESISLTDGKFIDNSIIPKDGACSSLLTSIIEHINKSSLEEETRREIIQDSTSSFYESNDSGDQFRWLTRIIDDAVQFFFPDISNFSETFEKWVDNFDKGSKGLKIKEKVKDFLENNNIQDILKKTTGGGIDLNSTDMQNAIQGIQEHFAPNVNQYLNVIRNSGDIIESIFPTDIKNAAITSFYMLILYELNSEEVKSVFNEKGIEYDEQELRKYKKIAQEFFEKIKDKNTDTFTEELFKAAQSTAKTKLLAAVTNNTVSTGNQLMLKMMEEKTFDKIKKLMKKKQTELEEDNMWSSTFTQNKLIDKNKNKIFLPLDPINNSSRYDSYIIVGGIRDLIISEIKKFFEEENNNDESPNQIIEPTQEYSGRPD